MEVRNITGEKTMPTTDNNDAAYWLPTHFLTDDDFLSCAGDRGFSKDPPNNFDLFPNDFDFDPFATLDSPVSSNGTDNCYNDDHHLLAELTRQLALSSLRETHRTHVPPEKAWMFSTSPQSTLNGLGGWSKRSGFSSNGSPSQVPSPPLSPPEAKSDAAWELLFEAAGEVARLKMNAIAAQLHHHHHHRGLLQNSSLTTKPHHHNTLYDFPAANQYYEQQLKKQEREKWYSQQHQQSRPCGGGGRGALDLPPSAWPTLRAGAHHQLNHRQQSAGPGMGAMFMSPGPGPTPAVKRQSTGTGVFLPRRARTQPQPQPQPEPRKKPTGCSTVLLPARVVQALNLDLENINNGVNHNSNSRFGSGYVTHHDVMIARRNAVLSQQRRMMKAEGAATMVGGHDFRLPSDWTY